MFSFFPAGLDGQSTTTTNDSYHAVAYMFWTYLHYHFIFFLTCSLFSAVVLPYSLRLIKRNRTSQDKSLSHHSVLTKFTVSTNASGLATTILPIGDQTVPANRRFVVQTEDSAGKKWLCAEGPLRVKMNSRVCLNIIISIGFRLINPLSSRSRLLLLSISAPFHFFPCSCLLYLQAAFNFTQ